MCAHCHSFARRRCERERERLSHSLIRFERATMPSCGAPADHGNSSCIVCVCVLNCALTHTPTMLATPLAGTQLCESDRVSFTCPVSAVHSHNHLRTRCLVAPSLPATILPSLGLRLVAQIRQANHTRCLVIAMTIAITVDSLLSCRGRPHDGTNRYTFVCTTCSGMLRGLNPPHKVKALSMAVSLTRVPFFL